MSVPTCAICGHRSHWLKPHLEKAHGLTVEQYLKKHPGAPTASEEVFEQLQNKARGIRRREPPSEFDLKIDFLGFEVPVNPDVPKEACLPLPDHYRFAEHGLLRADMVDAAVSILRGRTGLIFGPPGTGKDAFVHAISSLARRPALMKQIQPAADINSWFYSRSFDQEGTDWEYGTLFKAITEGYLVTEGPRAGQRIPYLILLTDLDRATKAQMEAFRLIFDSIDGRVEGPGGQVFEVLPGTQFLATANTSGGGDPRGRMVSANVIDGSMMDRFDFAVEFHLMDWQDEEPICKQKFPLLAKHADDMFPIVGRATSKLRNAVDQGSLYAEFSHRAVCRWFRKAEDIVALTGKVPVDLVVRSMSSWMGLLPDDESRHYAMSLIENDIKGGIHGRDVDRSDERDDPLAGFGAAQ